MASPELLSEEEITLRNHFFPGWQQYRPGANSAAQPLYRIECKNVDEQILAEKVKPPYVRAEILVISNRVRDVFTGISK